MKIKIFQQKKKKYFYNKETKITKIIINRGLGKFSNNKIIIQTSINELSLITGQYPTFKLAKKSISNFKLREKTICGIYVTLRKNYLFTFLNNFIKFNCPNIYDFYGFSKNNFDKNGNFHFGINDQSIFNEINPEAILLPLGFNITIVFSQKNKKNNFLLLKKLNFPFSNN